MKRLYRSRRDSKLFGLCGGLAEQFNVDPTLLRLVLVVAAFFSAGTVIPLYIIAGLLIPKEPLFREPVASSFEYGNQGASGGFKFNKDKSTSNLDDMMKDIEKKAMEKELEQLRAKLARYESNQKTKGDE